MQPPLGKKPLVRDKNITYPNHPSVEIVANRQDHTFLLGFLMVMILHDNMQVYDAIATHLLSGEILGCFNIWNPKTIKTQNYQQ